MRQSRDGAWRGQSLCIAATVATAMVMAGGVALAQPQPGAPSTPAAPTATSTAAPSASPSAPAPAAAPEPATTTDSKEGEYCSGFSADECGPGLSCVDHACTRTGAPAATAAPPPSATTAPAEAPPAQPDPSTETTSSAAVTPPMEEAEWSSSPSGGSGGGKLEGMRPFAGLGLMPGVGIGVPYERGRVSDAKGAFLFALRGGLFLDQVALELEFSPVTFLPYAARGVDPILQMNVAAGYYIDLGLLDGLYFPIRGGLGFAAVNFPTRSDAGMVIRLDLINVAYLLPIGSLGDILLEANLPSFRQAHDFDNGAALHWLFGFNGAWVF